MKKVTSTSRRHPDGSVSVTWPRKATDTEQLIQIRFLPIVGGPLVTVNAVRDHSLDEVGPFGTTTWGYRISPGEVYRATRKAEQLMREQSPSEETKSQ